MQIIVKSSKKPDLAGLLCWECVQNAHSRIELHRTCNAKLLYPIIDTVLHILRRIISDLSHKTRSGNQATSTWPGVGITAAAEQQAGDRPTSGWPHRWQHGWSQTGQTERGRRRPWWRRRRRVGRQGFSCCHSWFTLDSIWIQHNVMIYCYKKLHLNIMSPSNAQKLYKLCHYIERVIIERRDMTL